MKGLSDGQIRITDRRYLGGRFHGGQYPNQPEVIIMDSLSDLAAEFEAEIEQSIIHSQRALAILANAGMPLDDRMTMFKQSMTKAHVEDIALKYADCANALPC